jgi:hypothetical protein
MCIDHPIQVERMGRLVDRRNIRHGGDDESAASKGRLCHRGSDPKPISSPGSICSAICRHWSAKHS